MGFVQIFEFKTSDLDGVRAIDEQWRQATEGKRIVGDRAMDEEWRKATEGKRTVRREVLAADHNQPGRYFAIVFFDSYESAIRKRMRKKRK